MKRRTPSRRVAAAALGPILLIILACPLARSAELVALPSVSLEESYDTNVFNRSDNEETDFVTRARPALTLSLGAFHTTVNLVGGFEFEKFADHGELDTSTATRNIDLSAQDPIRVSPVFSILPSVRYLRTEDSIRRIALTQAPIPGLPPSEQSVTERASVTEWGGSLTGIYLVSPNLETTLRVGGVDRNNTLDDLDDSRVYRIGGSFGYRTSPRFVTGLYADADRNDFRDGPDSDVLSGGVSASYAISPNHVLEGRAGPTYVKEKATSVLPENTSWHPNARFSLLNEWQDLRIALSATYDVAGGGSFGRTTERIGVLLTFSDRFAESWWFDAGGSYQYNRSLDEAAIVDLQTAEASVGLRYAAATWAFATLSGNILHQVSDGVEGDDVDRASLTLGLHLTTRYPLF